MRKNKKNSGQREDERSEKESILNNWYCTNKAKNVGTNEKTNQVKPKQEEKKIRNKRIKMRTHSLPMAT